MKLVCDIVLLVIEPRPNVVIRSGGRRNEERDIDLVLRVIQFLFIYTIPFTNILLALFVYKRKSFPFYNGVILFTIDLDKEKNRLQRIVISPPSEMKWLR